MHVAGVGEVNINSAVVEPGETFTAGPGTPLFFGPHVAMFITSMSAPRSVPSVERQVALIFAALHGLDDDR